MVEYIHALQNSDALDVLGNASIVDISSSTNQKFLDQIKRDMYVAKILDDQVYIMMASGVNYISKFTKTKTRTTKVIAKLESELNAWEEENF